LVQTGRENAIAAASIKLQACSKDFKNFGEHEWMSLCGKFSRHNIPDQHFAVKCLLEEKEATSEDDEFAQGATSDSRYPNGCSETGVEGTLEAQAEGTLEAHLKQIDHRLDTVDGRSLSTQATSGDDSFLVQKLQRQVMQLERKLQASQTSVPPDTSKNDTSAESAKTQQPAEKKKRRRHTRPHAEEADDTTSEPDSPTPLTRLRRGTRTRLDRHILDRLR
jgi:hypothetical protein